MSKINYIVADKVKKVIQETLGKFKFNEFKKLDSGSEMINYAKQHLPLMGTGTSRTVFALSSGKVLKIAGDKNVSNESIERGIAQNKQEVSLFTDPFTKPITTEIYNFDDDFLWLVSEIAKPFKTAREFENATNLNMKLVKILSKLAPMLKYNEKVNEQYLEKLTNIVLQQLENDTSDLIQTNADKNNNNDSASQDKINKIKEQIASHLNNSLFQSMQKLRALGVSTGDVTREQHWGKTANGKVVLIDYGLTREIFKKYYSH